MGRFAERVLGLKKPKQTTLDKVTADKAHEIQTVNSLPYFKKLLKKIQAAASTPIPVGSHEEMITAVGKGNAYRELLAVLLKDKDTAERILAHRHDSRRQNA